MKYERLIFGGMAILATVTAGAAWSAAALRTESELVLDLKAQPPCCVIDARSAARRAQQPLADALTYQIDLRINPTSIVIVIGDDDRSALKIAKAIAADHPDKLIYGVRGGLKTWDAVSHTLATQHQASSGAAPANISFVIPKNTCESGTTLQELISKPAQ